MIQTVEQILENVRALPISEWRKFYDLAEEEKQKILSEKRCADVYILNFTKQKKRA